MKFKIKNGFENIFSINLSDDFILNVTIKNKNGFNAFRQNGRDLVLVIGDSESLIRSCGNFFKAELMQVEKDQVKFKINKVEG
jgi:hypothetical protein